jgi:hypothetical protein
VDYPVDFSGNTNEIWQAVYHLRGDERLMLSAFPARPFDWEKSYATNIVFTQAAQGMYYGQMPPNWLIRKWSQYFNIMVVWHNGLYIDNDNTKKTYAGPYEIANPEELSRGVGMAHKVGLKVILYTSFYYFYEKYESVEEYLLQIRRLKKEYQIDGIYIDGLLTETSGHQNDQMFTNWELIRRLRDLFGDDGVIVYHGTAYGHSAATMPNVDAYCDATLNGENVPYTSFNDPYIRFHVKKYGISNTVALWKPGPGPYTENERPVIDAVLNMNGRVRYWAGVSNSEAAEQQPPIWISGINADYHYYLHRLLLQKQSRSSMGATTDTLETFEGAVETASQIAEQAVSNDGLP